MRLALRILAAIVVLVVLLMGGAVLIGSRLPVGHVAARQVTLRQPAESVWSAIITYERHPSWRSNLEKVEVLPPVDGRPRRREFMNGEAMLLETIESVPPRRLVEQIADTTSGFGGTWTFELDTIESGTRVVIVERGRVYNPIFRFVARYFMDAGSTADRYLRDLGRRFGEDVSPVEAPTRNG